MPQAVAHNSNVQNDRLPAGSSTISKSKSGPKGAKRTVPEPPGHAARGYAIKQRASGHKVMASLLDRCVGAKACSIEPMT